MYKEFADVYDRLTRDIGYAKWADYLESAFLKFGEKPSLVLDLGCGTGNITLELARRGYDMIGVDLSCDMLSKAWEKARNNDLDILLLNQDMHSFELYGTVDSVVCMLDSINYITDDEGLTRIFKGVRNYLNPGGLFIFDINSEYKLSRVLPDSTYYELDDDISWIWHNTYDTDTRLCTFDLTVFSKSRDNLYERFDETHVERAYSDEEIKAALCRAGLQFLGGFGNLTFDPPVNDEQRIFYIARKE